MKTQRNRGRNAPRFTSNVLTDVFGNLARDLSLHESGNVILARKSLGDGDIPSFLRQVDSWAEQQYSSSSEHFAWNQLACLLKKFPFQHPLLDPEEAAMKKFYAAEHRCRRTNQKFALLSAARKLPDAACFLHSMRRWILKLIGCKPNYSSIWSSCDFGPGASVGTSGTLTHSGRKIQVSPWTVTPGCLPFAKAALSVNSLLWEHLMGVPYSVNYFEFSELVHNKVVLTRANNIICVPKTAKVHRTIAVEPLLNGFVQKGIDRFLRKKLRRVGIDLSDQSWNQHFAKLGSEEVSNPFSTIDLSMASDSLATEVVRNLLPPDWFAFLDACRSRYYASGTDSEVRYEKFASMGNGFCFPLESLIFAAVVHSVYEETGDLAFKVYGDDIVVRQSSALLVIERLRYLGFRVNTDKTFIHGPFRESCGADYFRGENVRPYYIDEKPNNWVDIFKWMNGLRRLVGEESHSWYGLLESVPAYWRLFRPQDGPDDAITTTLDRFMGSRVASWDRPTSSWRWKKVAVKPLVDAAGYSPACQMYGLLRGSRSIEYQVAFTHRRKTVTRVTLS